MRIRRIEVTITLMPPGTDKPEPVTCIIRREEGTLFVDDREAEWFIDEGRKITYLKTAKGLYDIGDPDASISQLLGR